LGLTRGEDGGYPINVLTVVLDRPFSLIYNRYEFLSVHCQKKFKDWLGSLFSFAKNRTSLSLILLIL
jgi:hypothetical protein